MTGRSFNLQALRGVACLLVVVFHMAGTEKGFGLGFSPLRPLLWFGFAGVDLFFVLSGYIIAATSHGKLGNPSAVPGYLFRRIWRVYPTYWAALGLAVLLNAWVDPLGLVAMPTAEWVEHALLLPPSTGGVPKLFPVAWSMSYEVLFYLAFAAAMLVPKRVGWAALGLWAGVILWAAGNGVVPANRFAKLATSLFVLEFLAGVLIAHVSVRLSARSTVAVLACTAAWAGVGSWLYFDPDPLKMPTWTTKRVAIFGMPAALVVFAAVGREAAGGRLRTRWLIRAGDASYSIYLAHWIGIFAALLGTMAVGWSHRKLPHVGWILVTFAAAVGLGVLLHYVVERHVLAAVKKRQPPQPQDAADKTTPQPMRVAA